MPAKVGGAWVIAKSTANQFIEDGALTLGAALAYYAIFALAPVLVLAVSVAGLVFSQPNAQHQVAQQLQSVVGQKAAGVVQSMMAAQTRSGSVIATALGIVVLLMGASGVFGQLKTSLNQIWKIRPKPGRAVAELLLDRALAIGLVLGIGVLLMASMVLTAVISKFYNAISRVISLPGFTARILDLGISWLVLTLLFALIFKLLPDVRVRWRDIWLGALVTALLFLGGEYVLGLYLGRQGTTSSYGAAGSVVLLLMWIYYSALILLIGAEFTHAYVRQTGHPVEPGKFGEPIEPAPQPAG